jgi:hypothetical protein
MQSANPSDYLCFLTLLIARKKDSPLPTHPAGTSCSRRWDRKAHRTCTTWLASSTPRRHSVRSPDNPGPLAPSNTTTSVRQRRTLGTAARNGRTENRYRAARQERRPSHDRVSRACTRHRELGPQDTPTPTRTALALRPNASLCKPSAAGRTRPAMSRRSKSARSRYMPNLEPVPRLGIELAHQARLVRQQCGCRRNRLPRFRRFRPWLRRLGCAYYYRHSPTPKLHTQAPAGRQCETTPVLEVLPPLRIRSSSHARPFSARCCLIVEVQLPGNGEFASTKL